MAFAEWLEHKLNQSTLIMHLLHVFGFCIIKFNDFKSDSSKPLKGLIISLVYCSFSFLGSCDKKSFFMVKLDLRMWKLCKNNFRNNDAIKVFWHFDAVLEHSKHRLR